MQTPLPTEHVHKRGMKSLTQENFTESHFDKVPFPGHNATLLRGTELQMHGYDASTQPIIYMQEKCFLFHISFNFVVLSIMQLCLAQTELDCVLIKIPYQTITGCSQRYPGGSLPPSPPSSGPSPALPPIKPLSARNWTQGSAGKYGRFSSA